MDPKIQSRMDIFLSQTSIEIICIYLYMYNLINNIFINTKKPKTDIHYEYKIKYKQKKPKANYMYIFVYTQYIVHTLDTRFTKKKKKKIY